MWASFILLFFIFSITVIYKRFKYDQTFWKHFLEIPGPKVYPFIGNLLDIAADSEILFLNDRKRAKIFYPIYKLWGLSTTTVFIVSPEDIEVVLSNIKHAKKDHTYDLLHDWLRTGLLNSTGSNWQKRRKTLTPEFNSSILEEFVNIFNRETENLLEELAKKCTEPYIDVVKPFTESTIESTTGILTCMTCWKFIYLESYNSLGIKKNMPLVKSLQNFSSKVLKNRQKLFAVTGVSASYSVKKRLALLDFLLTVKDENGYIDKERIEEEIDSFMFEGHDTTSMLICYILMALANEKVIQGKIVKEMQEILDDYRKLPSYNDLIKLKYMERCIKECLRLYPSIPFISRKAGEDIKTFSGYTIPKGCDVMMSIYDLHHSPHVWEDPEKFDPDRFLLENIEKRHPFAYLPFSAGPRNCIGQNFAILEIKAALCSILKKFELKPVDTPNNLRFKPDVVLKPFDEIRVKFEPRK